MRVRSSQGSGAIIGIFRRVNLIPLHLYGRPRRQKLAQDSASCPSSLMAPFALWLLKVSNIPKGVISDASSAALPNIMDFSHEESTNAHAKITSKDMKSSEISVPNGTDSGYVSAATTPDRGVSGSPPVFTDGVVLPARKLFPRKSQLKPFDKDTPESVQNRFSDFGRIIRQASVRPPVQISEQFHSHIDQIEGPWCE